MTRSWIVPLALAAGLLPFGASAACQGQGGLVCGGGAPSLSTPGGFQVSRGGGFKPLDPARALSGGDRLLSGAAEATLFLGPSCSTPIGPGSVVSLTRQGGQTCARVTNAPGGAPPSQAAAVAGEPVPLLTEAAIAAGAAGAIGVGIAVGTSGSRSQPVTVSAQ